jgi:L,D-transpeptidase YcbB
MIFKRDSANGKPVSKWLAMALAVSLAVPAVASSAARAEPSEETKQLMKKRKSFRSDTPFARKPAQTQSSHGAPQAQGKATTVTEVVTSSAVVPFIGSSGAESLSTAQARYESIVSSGGWPSVPKGAYKKGSTSKGIVALNRRLFVEGYLRQEATEGEFASVYTSATQDAVARFQKNMGLAATGNVDGPTLAQLNVPASARLTAIRANIPRLAAYSKDLGERYVVVNVPAQQIQTINGGRVYSQHNAIVGRPERPTPVVMTPLSNVAFNPYWNAPASIVEKDIIPKMSSGNSDILRQMNIKVFKGVGGPEIDPRSVNWSRAVADDYHFRQEPGGENAMATAKINFTSPFGIYLHDTPEPQLFQAGGRFFSSGCVRVDKVAVLINWIFNGGDGINQSRIAELAQNGERLDQTISNPPQLRVAYLTAWPAANGTVAFRNDVYQLDGTGFITGQPLPVGEKSAEGQRFVLKPIPRQVAAVDAAEAEGFSWFRFGRSSKYDSERVGQQKTVAAPGKPAKTVKVAAKAPAKSLFASSPATAKSSKSKVKPKGLFDWASYKAEGKKADPKKVKVAKKKKPVAEKQVAEKTVKKTREKVAAKAVSGKEKPVQGAKPAAVAKDKKPQSNCKPAADGKLPKGCEVATAKPKIKPKATN